MADSSSGLTWKTLNGRGIDNTILGYQLPTRSSKLIARLQNPAYQVVAQGARGPGDEHLPGFCLCVQVHDGSNLTILRDGVP